MVGTVGTVGTGRTVVLAINGTFRRKSYLELMKNVKAVLEGKSVGDTYNSSTFSVAACSLCP